MLKILDGGKISKVKIALLGANGQLGSSFQNYFNELSNSGIELAPYSRLEMDLTDTLKIKKMLENFKPNYVINAAAFTDVDTAESDQSANMKVNYEAVVNLGNMLSNKPAKLIHFSTDFVFSSNKLKFFSIHDETCPINKYGEAKSKAEKFLRNYLPKNSIIIRTAWLYGNSKKCFVNKIQAKAKVNQEISVVDDQFGQPTWTIDLVEATIEILKSESDGGIYHVAGDGVTSRFLLAQEVYELMGKEVSKVRPIKSAEIKTKARRPKYSCLDLSDWEKSISWKPKNWRESLVKHLANVDRSL